MPVSAVFPQTSPRAGMYESFYLRAVSPDEPVGAWIRYTVHKRPGAAARGSLWCTVFDAQRGRPFQHKLTSEQLGVPQDGWIAIGESAFGPEGARGRCGEASWSLRLDSSEPELRHLPRAWMYRAPIPRTKLTSPMPAASFDGEIVIPADPSPQSSPLFPPPPPCSPSPPSLPSPPSPHSRTLRLRGWHGMVGHNWGSEHAERWIWLHGIDFQEAPQAWLDVAIGRVRVGGWLSPWVANGVLSLDGERMPLGGLRARGVLVAETAERCRLSLPGPGGAILDAHVETPAEALAGWSYADPDGSEHDVANCSVAALTLTLRRPGLAPARTLHTPHGGAYELGMREHDHGVPVAPFADG